MAASGRRRRRRRPAAHENEERWLLTYADMITLLMALFIVMWSMSAVNISKFAALKNSLKAAFSPGHVLEQDKNVLTGQPSVLDGAGPAIQPTPPPTETQQTSQAQMQIQPITNPIEHAAAQQEVQNLRRLQAQIESYAQRHGFSGELRTSIDERGLVIRLLTDEVLFDTGQAVVKARSIPLLARIVEWVRPGGLVLMTMGAADNPGSVEDDWLGAPMYFSHFDSATNRALVQRSGILRISQLNQPSALRNQPSTSS